MSAIVKYGRELCDIGLHLTSILLEVRKDPELTDEQREDLTWQVARCRSSVVDATSALVELVHPPKTSAETNNNQDT